jgi:hypothetical protein
MKDMARRNSEGPPRPTRDHGVGIVFSALLPQAQLHAYLNCLLLQAFI